MDSPKRSRMLSTTAPRLFFSRISDVVRLATAAPVVSVYSQCSFMDALFPNVLGTHDGTFHCDEALALALLRTLPGFRDFPILRSRDPAYLARCKVIVDVGAQFEPSTGRLDHHQSSFTETWSPSRRTTKLSSAGIVFKLYGKEIIANLLQVQSLPSHDGDGGAGGGEYSEEDVSMMVEKAYSGFIEHVDAIDNGVDVAEETRYAMSSVLSTRVSYLNAPWTVDYPDSDSRKTDENVRFIAAMQRVLESFLEFFANMVDSILPARQVVQRALAKADGSPILVLDTFCNWKSHLLELEQSSPKTLFVVYKDTAGGWRVQAVPVSDSSFDSRKALPKPWRGLRDDELSTLTGIPGCVFCHAAGFIGGNRTFEGVMEMAKQAVAFPA
eukprot:ANDGO_00299.mRNA.1 UPF0160 protein C27H6.8